MSARSGFLLLVAASAAGAASGAIAVALLAPSSAPTVETREVYYVTQESEHLSPAPRDDGDAGRPQPVATSSPTAVPTAPTATDPFAQTPEEREAERLVLEARHADRIADHYHEPIDRAWAPRSEQRIAERLGPMVARMEGVQVESVDCRSETCAIQLAWDSFDQARQRFMPFIQADLGLPCEQSVILPQPDDPTAPYSGTVLLRNCTDLR